MPQRVKQIKRKEYAKKHMELSGNDYVPVFEDDTNFNNHCKLSNCSDFDISFFSGFDVFRIWSFTEKA